MTCDTLEGFVEVAREQVTVARARAAKPATLPLDLRDADELLTRYGLWAQDRYRKQRCASAEGEYRPPHTRGVDCEEPLAPFIPDWNAMKVQHALVVVPMQYRRVLQAHYIPQKEHPMAARRRHRITAATWEASRIEGLRHFWRVYRLRYELARDTVPPLLRYTV